MENKLLQFQKAIGVIAKDSKNPHFKNTYASLTQILGEVKPVLTNLGLVVLQPINDGKVWTVIMDNGNTLAQSSIDLPTNLAPQALGSAITYFRRYTLSSLLALEIDDDDAQSTNVKPQTNFDDAKSKLIVVSTLAELQNAYMALNPVEKANKEVIELKDKLKLTLK